jgi:hypothetical protein
MSCLEFHALQLCRRKDFEILSGKVLKFENSLKGDKTLERNFKITFDFSKELENLPMYEMFSLTNQTTFIENIFSNFE